jgi:uncharacterized protein YndB with AHSA1/START domain
MSSIKKKVSSSKGVKNKKPAKPLKPTPKKSAVKKAAPKKAKPVAKPSPKKKSAPVKKVKLKPMAKLKKPVSTKKPVVKGKNMPKKPVKAPIKAKIAPKKAITKKVAPLKKVAPKKTEVKKVVNKPVAKKAPEVKKPMAAKSEAKVNKLAPAREVFKPVEKKELLAEGPKSPADVFSKKPVQKSATDVLAISNTIPVKQKHEISASKIALISNSITNPVKKTDSYAIKPEKEPAGKFEMEFVIHASSEMLYEFLSTPSGLSEWFCDDLNIRNGIYTFIWDDQLQQARLLKTLELQLVRFQWVDKTDGSYFEFRIQRDDLTNDISLIITDFADSAGDRESSKLLWNSQVEKLMHVIGSIF